jgi:hypothetical protein
MPFRRAIGVLCFLLRHRASSGLGRARCSDGGARLGRYRGTALRDHRDGGLPAAAATGADLQQLVVRKMGAARGGSCTSWSTPPPCWAPCTTCGWRRASSWSRCSTWRRFWGCSPCVCARRVARLAAESPGNSGPFTPHLGISLLRTTRTAVWAGFSGGKEIPLADFGAFPHEISDSKLLKLNDLWCDAQKI